MPARIRIEFDRPETCGKCMFYHESKIREQDWCQDLFSCMLGFMKDCKESQRNKIWQGCRLNRYAVPVAEYTQEYYIERKGGNSDG